MEPFEPPSDATDGSGISPLTVDIVRFARLLRRAGVAVGPAAVVDAVRAVGIGGLANLHDFYWTLHAIFATRRDQHAIFDQLFRLFWGKATVNLAPPAPTADSDPDNEEDGDAVVLSRRVRDALLAEMAAAAPPAEPQRAEIVARLEASSEEALRHRDFAEMTADEAAEAAKAIARLRPPADEVRTRRAAAAASPGAIDPRRTLRASLRTGGRMIPLRYRRPAVVRAPIVALVDISGSMSPYTEMLLRFLHGLGQTRRIHTFLFGTRLTNVTRQLRRRDVDEALAACSAAVADWSGGTRIAGALHEFNRYWSRRVLGQGAVVLLVTDGLERGNIDELGAEMDRLHRSSRRLIWLNPLLRSQQFAARARGIRAMLPHVDAFRPVHSVEAIADLCRALGEGDTRADDPRRWLKAS